MKVQSYSDTIYIIYISSFSMNIKNSGSSVKNNVEKHGRFLLTIRRRKHSQPGEH